MTCASLPQFRFDNTEGYSAVDLEALNTAWAAMPGEFVDDKSAADNTAALLLAAYDRGARGQALIGAAYGADYDWGDMTGYPIRGLLGVCGPDDVPAWCDIPSCHQTGVCAHPEACQAPFARDVS